MEVILPTDLHEKEYLAQGVQFVVGCDEVGRGCLAGPVVAGAVIFDWSKPDAIEELKTRVRIADSKSTTEKQRMASDEAIRATALSTAIGVIRVQEIDEKNIYYASLLAMRKAINAALERVPVGANVQALLDGNARIPYARFSQVSVVDGDVHVFSIAAASIIAKVYRDNLMRRLHKRFPLYDWDENVGYATPGHKAAIAVHGLTPFHRRSFCKMPLPGLG